MRFPEKLREGPERREHSDDASEMRPANGKTDSTAGAARQSLGNLQAQSFYQNGIIRRQPAQPGSTLPSPVAPFVPAPGQLGTEASRTTDSKSGRIAAKIDRSSRCGWTETVDLNFDPGACSIETGRDVEFVQPAAAAERLSTADFETLAQRYLQESTYLDGWYAIRITGDGKCAAPCTSSEMPIRVRINRRKGGKPIFLSKGKGREYANQLYDSTSDWTLRHEAGHAALGAADEYEESGKACLEGENVEERDYSLMADQVSWGRRSLLHPRHFSHILAWFERQYPACRIDLVELKRPHPPDFDITATFGVAGMGKSIGPSLDFGLRLGFGLDRIRDWAVSVGPHAHILLGAGEEPRNAYLLGLRFGLERRFTPSAGGLVLGGFAEVGYGKFSLDNYEKNIHESEKSAYGVLGARVGYGWKEGLYPSPSLDFSVGSPLGQNGVISPTGHDSAPRTLTGWWQLGVSGTWRF